MDQVFLSDLCAVNLQGAGIEGGHIVYGHAFVCVCWGVFFLFCGCASCSCSAVCVLPGCLLVSRAFCLGLFEKGKV